MERSDILRNILDNLSSQISSHTNPNNITNALKSVKNEKLYNELISHGYSVDVGVVVDRRKGGNAQKEIDFVVNRGDKRIYIQSAWQMNTDEKITRNWICRNWSETSSRKSSYRTTFPRHSVMQMESFM